MAEYGVLLTRDELEYLDELLRYEERRMNVAAQIRVKVKRAKELADIDAKTLRKRP